MSQKWHVQNSRSVSPDQWLTWSPQVGTCIHRNHPMHSSLTKGTTNNNYSKETKVTAPNGRWKKMVGRHDEWNTSPWRRHHGSSKPRRLISSADLLLLCTCSKWTWARRANRANGLKWLSFARSDSRKGLSLVAWQQQRCPMTKPHIDGEK